MRPETPTRIAFIEAEALVRQAGAARRTDAERVPLSRARGRVLAEAQFSPLNMPPFRQSSMDGFAVRLSDLLTGAALQIAGSQPAGADRRLALGHAEAIAVFTGAPLPDGADAVLVKEDALISGTELRARALPQLGQWIRRPGEDLASGDRLFEAGHRLSPVDIGVLATCGFHEVPCARRPVIALFTLGDELVAPGSILADGMVYDSNRAMLMTLLSEEGFEPLAWPALPDDPERIAAALRDAAGSADVLLTCGGVSVGDHDPLPALMDQEGEPIFWKVRSKPGAPVLFGRFGRSLWLGLPGNPVSVLATWLSLGRVLLDAMQGASAPRPRLKARLRSPLLKSESRLEFMRGVLSCDGNGQLWAEPDAVTGSHRLAAASRNNALLVLPEGSATFEGGSVIDAIAFGPIR